LQRCLLLPERARSVQHDAAIERELFGALVEYPSLIADAEVLALLCYATGSLALAIANLAHTADTLDQHLDLFEQPFQRIARERLVAPRADSLETVRHTVTSNLTKMS